ncbi:hypothetical protein AGABI2DRAFT_211843 [Agaricus bisporus var. bisporus H97]|uniref:hypothetical protein n=1 Tax=Agaricus bisporus var. bisporus (strain H97 / ATCC MYA-4626 / FGSC 10389) TaxID=936046 RepID=UPI00029F5412|nr:hypothetical protein AGABI2DRAFT_211843 [Agaricus bisporus var. bisporus H97]EKV42414.1 hypothetical protein AGABI2DRAFT_211843 [Agaricus bisporus var. bisporus H97]
MKKKLHLETKIRDAAISLSKVNSSNKRLSKQTDEQLDAARRRVDLAQTEYWSLSERANEVHRKLLEHRAGVLSHFVRSVEKKMGPSPSSYDSGYHSNRSTIMSPARTSTTDSSTGFPKPKFDGAHFFAGHVDAIVPKKILSPEAAASEILTLETKLKAATEALSAAKKQQVEMTRELSMVRLEKQEVETMMGLELQTAEETISALEKELPRLEGLDSEVQELLKEKEKWGEEKLGLEERSESLRARIVDLETRTGEADGADRLLAEVREESRRLLQEKEEEIKELQTRWQAEREAWEGEKLEWQENTDDDLWRLRKEMEKSLDENELVLQNANQELDDGLKALQQMIQEHGIVLFSREMSLKGLLEATSSHLQTVHSKLEGYGRAEADWSIAKRKLEEDVRMGLDKREVLTKELEDARRARDLAKRETRTLQQQDSARSSPIMPPKSLFADISVSPDADVNKLIATLLPVWAILPSPEARAAKFSSSHSRKYRTGSETGSPLSSTGNLPGVSSLSDLDVRSLKSLYNGSLDGVNGSPRTQTPSTFSIEAFVQRVQALITDDKALIARLVRFAQAHDLLKKNAERAQKLAQEGNAALETYQKQVKILEERNMGMNARVAAMQEELQLLHETIERLTAEKHQIESLAAEQAEACRQLTDANNVLSARTLTLAEEAASAPGMVRRQLEVQTAELKKQLEKAEAEIEEMKSAAQTQRAALFEEMNTMNEENTNLRAQLRAVKK